MEINDRSAFRESMNEILTIDRDRTVVLTVDMQRDYLDLGVASSPVAGDDAAAVLEHTAALLDFARAQRIPVVHAYVQRRPVELERRFAAGALKAATETHGVSQNVHAGVRTIPDRLEGSPTAELPAALVASGDVHVTTKKTLDSFYGTDLDVLLRRVFRTETVVIAGVNTDTCVHSTAFSASNHGYRPVVVSSCTASMRGKDQHWMALELMSRSIAWVLTLEELKAKVGDHQGARVVNQSPIGQSMNQEAE